MAVPRRRKSPARRRAVAVEPLRFAAGWRLLEPAAGAGGAVPDSVRVDLIRAADLVSLSVEAVGCELRAGGGSPPALRPIEGRQARLVITYPYQHLAEAALYESPALVPDDSGKPKPDPATPDGEAARPQPPIEVFPARSSRLVFAIAADESIEFSTEGILAAMGRLPLNVHPLALPGDQPAAGSVRDAPFIFLPDGLVLHLGEEGPVVAKAGRAMAGPDTSSAAGLAVQARELRRARAQLETRTAVPVSKALSPRVGGTVPTVTLGDTAFEAAPLFGIGGLVAELGTRPRPRSRLSRRPQSNETSIEAPFRLVISPSVEARWAHATAPVPADDEPHHVELWHSRLGTASVRPDGTPAVDERERAAPDHSSGLGSRPRDLDGRLARQEEEPRSRRRPVPDVARPGRPPHAGPPERRDLAGTATASRSRPSRSRRGSCGSLRSGPGSTSTAHGRRSRTRQAAMSSILEWDNVAPMGRDQYVRVVYPGYLYPIGHQAALVKVTERKMKDVAPSVAGLYQRKFLVIGEPRPLLRRHARLPVRPDRRSARS